MQPATIRRLLVFGVCVAGAAGLYLVPGIAGAPARLGSTPARHDLPTAATTPPPVGTTGPVSFTGSPSSDPDGSAGTAPNDDDAAGPQLAWIISHEGKVGLSRQASKQANDESMRALA